MKKIEILTWLLFLTLSGLAQTTPDAAIRAALQNHPLVKAAAFDVQAKKYAEKSALNLPNPELNAESPTGQFYAVGVLQSFEFPTVYARQKQVAKAETALAQAGQRISENGLRYTVRTMYLDAQVADYQSRQWKTRDSLYQAITVAAARQFEAGEIDFLQKTLVENEAGKVARERFAAEQLLMTMTGQLKIMTGLADLGTLLPLRPDTTSLGVSSGLGANPAVLYEQQAVQVAEKQVALAKSKALPNFSIGYMNQGERETPIDYRFRASIGLPLWVGQYRAGVNTAKAESQAAVARAAAQSQAVALQLQRTDLEALTALGFVRYYEQEALPRSRALISAVLRMRDAGQTDYVTFLKTLDEAFAIQREYAVQIQAFETARIQHLYLAGQ
jgi:outer membrane protein TolC